MTSPLGDARPFSAGPIEFTIRRDGDAVNNRDPPRFQRIAGRLARAAAPVDATRTIDTGTTVADSRESESRPAPRYGKTREPGPTGIGRTLSKGANNRMANNLEGKVALVTGGGQGLGAAICRTLDEAGAIAIPADLRKEAADEVARSLRSAGRDALALALDVRSEEQARRGFQKIVDTFGRLDVLVNNAGTDRTVSIAELPVEDWDRIMAVNLRGPFVLSKLAMEVMASAGRGHIVNIVSTAAKRAWANAAAYHASKWGLLGFSHALHVEARAQNIKVTAVLSGGMRTPFLLDRFPDLDPAVLQDPKNIAETVRFVLQQPDETVIPEVMVIPMRETSWP